MFGEVLIGGTVALGAGALAWMLRWRHLRALSLKRLAEPFVQVEEREEPEDPAPALPRHHWVPWLAGIVVGVGAWLAFGLLPAFCAALGLVVLVLAHLIESNLAEARALKLETQLVDSIDMIVGALGAGAGMMDAIDAAAREMPDPMRSELTNLVGRIRYGDPVRVVLEDLSERVPLETFRLFCFTLSVHDETGGSLTSTLSTVGRTIRDRLELRRRVRAQSTEAQASVVGILFITYGIAFVTWRTNPERMEEFVASTTGLLLSSAAMTMQAVGLLWMFRLSKIKY